MPELNWNKTTWERDYDWSAAGEEWSHGWGGSEAQWFGSLLPRIHRIIPCNRILEIAPGFGRWTKFLIPVCKEFVGIDLSLECVSACQKTFVRSSHARFHQNDGLSLKAADKSKFDFVFSFDSLVHADNEVFERYIPQIISLLADEGVALLHHSNFRSSGARDNVHLRSENVTADVVENLVSEAGGHIVMQELINWGGVEAIDCLSLFRKGKSRRPAMRLTNLTFMEEAKIIKDYQSVYCTIMSNSE